MTEGQDFFMRGLFMGVVAGSVAMGTLFQFLPLWPTEHLEPLHFVASNASQAESWSGTNGWRMIDCIDGDIHWKPRGNVCYLADKPN